MITPTLKKIAVIMAGVFLSIRAFSQDIDIDLDGNDSPEIFENPLFWVGAAVVLIILALIYKKKK